MTLVELRSVWAARDARYAGVAVETDEEAGDRVRQEKVARPGELTLAEIVAIREGRINEGGYLEPSERAQAWADAMTWAPPTPRSIGAPFSHRSWSEVKREKGA